MVQINLSSGQEQRCRSRDWTCGHDGAGGGVRWLVRLTLIPYCVRQKASGNLLCVQGAQLRALGWRAKKAGIYVKAQFSSVQSLRPVLLSVTPWAAARQASLSITNSQSLLKLISIESVMPSNHLILSRPLLLSPTIFPSSRVFSNESALRIRWPKYWSFSFSISPSNEHPGLISFRMDWLDLLTVQRTLKSLLQHHSSKASMLQCSAFFIGQLSHPYMTTGKTIALTRRTFVGKVMYTYRLIHFVV